MNLENLRKQVLKELDFKIKSNKELIRKLEKEMTNGKLRIA